MLRQADKKLWVSPKLEELSIDKTLTGPFPLAAEGVYTEGVLEGTPCCHGPNS